MRKGARFVSWAVALTVVQLPVVAVAEDAGQVRSGEVLVRLETPHGNIVIAVDTRSAPVTAANFLKHVDGGFYDGGRFHRATREDNYTPNPPNRPMMNIIQGGINPERRGDGFDPIPLERTSVTGITHVRGVVSMARGNAADTARFDFFILLDDQPSLDFGGLRFDDGQGAAAFGRVVEGLDVVEKIQQQPVEGQNLTPPVPITRAVRVGGGTVTVHVRDAGARLLLPGVRVRPAPMSARPAPRAGASCRPYVVSSFAASASATRSSSTRSSSPNAAGWSLSMSISPSTVSPRMIGTTISDFVSIEHAR